jgi:hypothetical protein
MEADYSIAVHRKLEEAFQNLALLRPMTFARYEAGTELTYTVNCLAKANTAAVRLRINRFVGGGFAGQVYQVQILAMESAQGADNDLEVGGVYAMKLLIPPSGFARLFRNLLYWIGFQGPFQLQVNPAAAKAGALWQKFIRRGAKTRFGQDTAVADIHAIFVDEKLGTCGELSEWIDGRTWRLEVDDQLDVLKRWMKGKQVDPQRLGSPEFRAKYEFMHQFVGLLHQMGAHEFARQYEWSTWKSQPNCLKRKDPETSPSGGLTAVDFRAGLALLPFLPMSPGDFKLILTGMMRGSLVQFDRGDIKKLEQFIHAHAEEFTDMQTMLSDLKSAEQVYRNSVPDVTHNHVRLVYSRQLWATLRNSAINAWRVRNLINERCRAQLQTHWVLAMLFAMLGVIPWVGRFCRRIWGQAFWRSHYRMMLTDSSYLRKAIRAKFIEKLIGWHRSGRVDDQNALKMNEQIWRCAYHWPLSLLPAGIHKFITDWQYAKDRLDYLFRRPIRLYFNNELREQWLRDMVTQGREKHLLNSEDAGVILSQIKEPFIQKYLKSLAVHVCTLPVTQVVSVGLAIIYVFTHPELPRAQAYAIGLGIIALFQVVPISPGSLVRGLYVLYLVIKERNFRDYNIAVFLGFFKYIGYLAFPIQMTYRYPALARFMAGHWATEAVYIVPVFGERGALLEHKIFCLFYNWPLTIRRRMRMRSAIRAAMQPRYWHMILCAAVGIGVFVITDLFYMGKFGDLPGLREIWGIALMVPLLCGAAVTLGAGGAGGWKRIVGAVVCGIMIGVFSPVVSAGFAANNPVGISGTVITGIWRAFIFTMLSVLGLLITEIGMPETNRI